MSDKAKFYNMTKPIKFRKFRLFLKSVGHTYEVGIFNIKYHYYNLLHKLDLIKRYSYRDMVMNHLSLPYPIEPQVIDTKNFKGKVVMQLVQKSNYNIDYFYKFRKDGTRKITLQLKDVQEHRIFVEAHLEEIGLKIDNRVYNVEHLPTFKCVTMEEPISFRNYNSPVEEPKYETITYDLRPIRNLMYSQFLTSESVEKIEATELMDTYSRICIGFKDRLKTITLQDIMR